MVTAGLGFRRTATPGKLEISRPRDCGVPQLLQHCVQLEWLSPEGNHVQNKIDVLGSARILDRELDGLCAGNDKLSRSRPQRRQQFEHVGPLRLWNHAALQRGSIASLNQ